MSDIDLINHYRVGIFGNIPIYLCREDGCWLGKAGVVEPSSTATKGALSIGGGSGEHPAVVLNAPWNSVLFFVGFYSDAPIKQLWPELIFCDGKIEEEWEHEFMDNYGVYKDALTFRQWIITCIGEFIFFMLPDLHPSIREVIENNPDVESPSFDIITIPWDKYPGNGSDYFSIRPEKKVEHVPLGVRGEAPRH